MKKSHLASQIAKDPDVNPLLNYWPWLIPVLIFMIYGKTIQFDFTGDDVLVTAKNSYVQKGIFGLQDIFTHSYLEGYTSDPDPLYRPLPLASYAIEKQFFGNKAGTYHFFQLLWYVFACYLFFKLLRKINCPEWMVFWSVVIFLIHPIHTEVVANIKSRDEIMSFSFLMISLLFFLQSKGIVLTIRYGLSLLFFLLGTLSKESTLPMLMAYPVFAYFFLDRNFTKSLRHLIPFLLVALLFIFIIRTPFIQNEFSLTLIDNSLIAGPDFISRFPTLVILFAKYVLMCFIPYPLSYDYSYPQIPLYGLDSLPFIFAILFLVFILCALIYFFHKNIWIAVGLIWFLLGILVTSNFFFLHGATFAERFLFSPLAGIVLAVFGFAEAISRENPSIRKWINYFLILLSLLFTFQSSSRTNIWKNDDSLFKSGPLTSPNSARTNMFYGRYWYNMYKRNPIPLKNSNLLDSAIAYYNTATNLYPDYTTAWHFKSWAYREKGLPELEEASLRKAYDTDSTYFPALLSLAITQMKKNDFTNAIALLQKANNIRFNVFDIAYNLGYCYRMQKDYVAAIQHLENAHRINPNREEPLNQLVKIYRDDLNDLVKARMYNDKLKVLNVH